MELKIMPFFPKGKRKEFQSVHKNKNKNHNH
jgi:hypothetical protein